MKFSTIYLFARTILLHADLKIDALNDDAISTVTDGIKVNNISVHPNPSKTGDRVHMIAVGRSASKIIQSGRYEISLKGVLGISLGHFQGNVCEPNNFDLPFGSGKLSIEKIPCPIAANKETTVKTLVLVNYLPPGVSVDIVIDGYGKLEGEDKESKILSILLRAAHTHAEKVTLTRSFEHLFGDGKKVQQKQKKHKKKRSMRQNIIARRA